MLPIENKVDDFSTLPAAQFNSLKDELENIIKIYLTLGVDNFQISRVISMHVAFADFYTDQGGADAYSLVRLAPHLFVQAVPEALDGMRVRFFAANTNTGSAGGVTVAISGTAPNLIPVKKFDGSPLGANAIVAGEMTELVYLVSKGGFIVASSSDTRMITQNTTLTVGLSGQQFTTLHDANEFLNTQYIAGNAIVTIQIEGRISETQETAFSHSEGAQVEIVGAPPLTVDIDGVNSVSGGAGGFSIEYEISASLTDALVGDYIFIYDTISGGPDALKFYNKKHEGLWEITALTASTVTVTNKFGFSGADSPKANDLAIGAGSGKITFLLAQITYANDGILFIRGSTLGALKNIVIINTHIPPKPAAGAFLSIGSTINTLLSFSVFFFGVVSKSRIAIQMTDTLLTGRQIIAAISDDDLNFALASCNISTPFTIISNASGGDRNFEANNCNISTDELVVCGSNGTLLVSETIGFSGGTNITENLFVIANKVVGLRMTGGIFSSNFSVIVDNAVGLEVWASGAFASLSQNNVFRVRDNNRGGGANRVGVRIINGSSLVLGVDEAGGHFEIAEITITGHTTMDLQVRMCGSAGLFSVAGSIVKANANNVASIIHNVAITNPSTSDGGIITLEP